MPTFAQFLENWLRLSTTRGLNNPLVKMPIKRFRLLREAEYQEIANGGHLLVGTMNDRIRKADATIAKN